MAEAGEGGARERGVREMRDALGLLAMAAAVQSSTVAEHLELLLKVGSCRYRPAAVRNLAHPTRWNTLCIWKQGPGNIATAGH